MMLTATSSSVVSDGCLGSVPQARDVLDVLGVVVGSSSSMDAFLLPL